MKTSSPKAEEIQRKWYLINAKGQVLGRLASRVARILRGKDKPFFSPHLDVGDHVVVINADKVVLKGKKLYQKVYYHHSGYPGGLKAITAQKLLQKHPERLLEHAVRGMLPKNKLGDAIFKKLRVYAGSEHPHQAQVPEPLKL